MSNCDCCRFRSEKSAEFDPTCQRTITTSDPFEVTGDLEFMLISGFVVSGGSGVIRHRRLPHPTFLSGGWEVVAVFSFLEVDSQPTSGKQSVFADGWLLELDWSDEILRAYECDDEGNPVGSTWYEQRVSYMFDLPLSTPIQGLDVRIMMGEVPGTSTIRKVVTVGPTPGGIGIPVISKESSSLSSVFWYGIGADHQGDDMAFSSRQFRCTNSLEPPAPIQGNVGWWFCNQMPFVWDLDLSEFSGGFGSAIWIDPCPLVGMAPVASAPVNPHFAYRDTVGVLDGGASWTMEFLLSMTEDTLLGRGASCRLSVIEQDLTPTPHQSPIYGAFSSTASYKPDDWDCLGTNQLSNAQACVDGPNNECIPDCPDTISIAPLGLIKAPTPP